MRIITFMFLIVATACTSTNQRAVSLDPSSYNFTIEYPEGWKKLNTKRFLIITKDDPFSQYILAQQRHVNKPFGHTEKRIRVDMPPQEAAEVILDEIKSDDSVLDLKVLETVPAFVSYHDGFRIVFDYKSKEGYKFKTIYYGFVEGQWFYSLRYNAVKKHYTSREIATFQRVLNSFKIMEGGSN